MSKKPARKGVKELDMADIFARRLLMVDDVTAAKEASEKPASGQEQRLVTPTHGLRFNLNDFRVRRNEVGIRTLRGGLVSPQTLQKAEERDPPALAEFLLTLLATNRRADAMIGDLNELFTGERRKYGRRRAVRLYWARTLRSLGPLLWRAIGKALKWGAVIAAARRFFGGA